MFNDATEEFTYMLSFDEKGFARSKIFLALPETLRQSFWAELGEQLLREAQASPERARALGYHVDLDSTGDVS